jgi:hypothetical protein
LVKIVREAHREVSLPFCFQHAQPAPRFDTDGFKRQIGIVSRRS